MKMPRWLVLSLLSASVLVVLGCGVWWWVTWPERTAREFLTLVEARQWEKANEFVVPNVDARTEYEWISRSDMWAQSQLVRHRRTFFQILTANQNFGIGELRNCFEVTRGQIVDAALYWAPTGRIQPDVRE